MVTPPLRILTVCTHNQTRSVIAGALLDQRLREFGVDAVIRTGGTKASGHAPTDTAVRMLRDRGVDVSQHRGTRVTSAFITHADLIVTAERDHVVWIAGQWPQAFGRTYTLPEAVELAEQVGPRAGRPFAAWREKLSTARGAASEYLNADIGELSDPTGGMRRTWDTSFASIDDLTQRLAEMIR